MKSQGKLSKIRFHPDVLDEIKSSYIWYQEQTLGLGDDYLNELESSYQAIIELPDTWPRFANKFRRFLLSKFPYSVVYRISGDTVFVVAVMHNSRKPGYWRKRIGN